MSGEERKVRIELNDDELAHSMRSVISKTAVGYSGDAIFLPSVALIAKGIGITRQTVQNRGGFHAWLEYSTGLTVIHRGMVLGDPDDLIFPPLKDFF